MVVTMPVLMVMQWLLVMPVLIKTSTSSSTTTANSHNSCRCNTCRVPSDRSLRWMVLLLRLMQMSKMIWDMMRNLIMMLLLLMKWVLLSGNHGR